MQSWLPAFGAVAVVSLISLVGAVAGLRWLRSHGAILALVAVAAGALLGDAFLHLLPEAADHWGGFPLELAALVLAGFMVFFLLEVFLRAQHAHGEALEQDHGHSHPDAHGGVQPFGWMNLIGDGVHNFLDGAVLAAAFSVDLRLGFATTVAVVLHEIPQELGDFAVLLRSGMSRGRALLWNLGTALTAVAGAALFFLLPFPLETVERWALPLTAGGFLYIAAADLVPELHHHAGDRHAKAILLGVAGGVAAMALLLVLE
ncbi:MAG TPA: ZIP family metal transporter [Candidatus Thermoplasmatota archaeon]|nr:ZIP family metal transporter [Candidatus Thermoplasmatota archaeon]